MKKNLIFYMLLLFMALSVWLSIKIMKANDLIEVSQIRHSAVMTEYTSLQYQLDNLQKAFHANFKMNPQQLLIQTFGKENQNSNYVLLYLKPYACSPCNLPAINNLIRLLGQSEGFYVFSHTSNMHFLTEITEEVGRNYVTIWLETKLYNYTDDGYDAELLFLNGEKLITGRLPLELLKDNHIFNLVIQGLIGLDDD